ncbi:MAG TPA: futalosine hydrolase [Thermodesulfobacteriaceae bacterium]|nr:futalosine hydrolase [Thermodesulfobacteriaceae bacterium]
MDNPRRKPAVIVSPTGLEMKPLMPAITRQDFPCLVCGLGAASTALHLTRFMEQAGPHMVILAGTAGCYRRSGAEPGDVCIATSETFGDLGRCGPGGYEPIHMDGQDISLEFELESVWRKIIPEAFLERHGMLSGPMVSLSCITGSEDQAEVLYERHRAVAENMEGAAAAQVCAFYGVPLLEFRAISNYAGDLCKRNWELDRALDSLAEILTELLESQAIKQQWQYQDNETI